MQRIQNFTNWALGLLAVICIIYLVYHGVMLLIKFDDDKAQSEAFGSIKTIAWVL
jgi:threonine/homoserine/homoserine lactone efflux protein